MKKLHKKKKQPQIQKMMIKEGQVAPKRSSDVHVKSDAKVFVKNKNCRKLKRKRRSKLKRKMMKISTVQFLISQVEKIQMMAVLLETLKLKASQLHLEVQIFYLITRA